MSKPWLEKYRPRTLEDVRGHAAIKRSFAHYIQSGHMPNVMLHGPPGTGKTTLCHAYARDLFGSDFDARNFKEMNSSDDRGIKKVRELTEEVQYGPSGNAKFRIIYLDEMDGMTPDAQDALKRTMETSHRNVRWMASLNNLNKIIEALQSRMTRFEVLHISTDLIKKQLIWIAEQEEVAHLLSDDTYDQIIRSSGGDQRNSISLMEGLPFDGKPITPELIRGLSPYPEKEKVKELISLNWNSHTEMGYRSRESVLQELLRQDTTCAKILDIMFNLFETEDLRPGVERWKFMMIVGEFEVRVSQANPVHQLRCCLDQIREIGRNG